MSFWLMAVVTSGWLWMFNSHLLTTDLLLILCWPVMLNSHFYLAVHSNPMAFGKSKLVFF